MSGVRPGTNRLLFVLTAVILAAVFVGALFAAGIVVETVRGQGVLPYEFTEEIYDASQFEVCPGDVVEWEHTAIVNGRLQIIAANAWLDPATQQSQLIEHTGRQLLFTDRDLLHDYYAERGRDFNLSLYPITVTRPLTATVPAMVEDGPLLIVFAIIYSDKEGDTYTVPFWALGQEACEARPSGEVAPGSE